MINIFFLYSTNTIDVLYYVSLHGYMSAWPNSIILSHAHFLLSWYMIMMGSVADLGFFCQGPNVFLLCYFIIHKYIHHILTYLIGLAEGGTI